jgi:hypothetical protein
MSEVETAPAAATVRGETPVTVRTEDDARERFGWETRTVQIHCNSGRVHEGRWSGPPLAPLLEAAGPPADATHLVIAARDGYQVCVPLGDALEGMLALESDASRILEEADGESSTDHDEIPDLPRFLADVDPARTIQGVDTIEAVSLGPGEDRGDYESF